MHVTCPVGRNVADSRCLGRRQSGFERSIRQSGDPHAFITLHFQFKDDLARIQHCLADFTQTSGAVCREFEQTFFLGLQQGLTSRIELRAGLGKGGQLLGSFLVSIAKFFDGAVFTLEPFGDAGEGVKAHLDPLHLPRKGIEQAARDHSGSQAEL